MPERTLILVKPDAVRRNLIGEVISRIERKGLKVIAMDLRTIDRVTAEAHYAEHAGKAFQPLALVHKARTIGLRQPLRTDAGSFEAAFDSHGKRSEAKRRGSLNKCVAMLVQIARKCMS